MPARPRDAASLIYIAQAAQGWRVLTGYDETAGDRALTFPGDAVRPDDADVRPRSPLSTALLDNIAAPPDRAAALANAALRAAYEVAGVLPARPAAPLGEVPRGSTWRRARAHGLAPDHGPLRLLGRAISPAEAETRRHSRFFLLDAADCPAALFGASRLSETAWRPLGDLAKTAREYTARVVLARLEEALGRHQADPAAASASPFLISYRGGRAVVRSIAE